MTLKLNFFLAKIDPDGNCTDGIEYEPNANPNIVPNPYGSSQSLAIQSTAWDPTRYLNVWTVLTIDFGGENGPSTGSAFASFPSSPFLEQSGIVAGYLMSDMTFAHECGHYLGLFHVFGCSQNDCETRHCGESELTARTLNDYVADTNPAIDAIFPLDCSETFEETCFTSECQGIDSQGNPIFAQLPYPKENFMAFGSCRETFTNGQSTRMYHFLNNSFLRNVWYPGYIIKSEMIVDKPTNFHKDVTIHPGGRLVINSEVIMAEGTSITVLQGGKLEVVGGHIRGCDISETERGLWSGIKVFGRNQDGFDVELIENEDGIRSVIEDVTGFVVDMNSSSIIFPGNGSLNSVGTIFNNVGGLVNLASLFPASNGSNIERCIQNGGEFGVKNLFAQEVDILDSKFFDIEKECVSSVGGSFLIQGNEFHGDEVDVALTHFFRGRPSIINGDNEFKGNRFGIRASGATFDNHIFNKNTFYGQSVRPDPDAVDLNVYDVDIYMDGISDYTISENKFFGVLGVASRATVNTNDIGDNNLVNTNTFEGNLNGIYPHASNPNYFFSNNCFATQFIDARIVKGIPNQGVEGGTPPNNCFTHQGNPNPGFTVFDITGSPAVFDYVDPIEEVIDCRLPIIAHPNVNILFTNQNPLICEIEDEFNEQSPQDSNQSLFDSYAGIATYIEQNDFSSARLGLASIDQNTEEGMDLHYVAESVITILESRANNALIETEQMEQSIRQIALKESFTSGFAQAVHYYLTGEFVDNLDLTYLDEFSIDERSFLSSELGEEKGEFKIYPNPASNYVNLENLKGIERITVYDLFGNRVFSGAPQNRINTSLWSDGIYIFEVEPQNGNSTIEKILIAR